MKRNLALSVLIAATSFQASAGFGNPGLSGEISLFAGYASSESNFNTDNKTKTGELDSVGESETDTFYFPLGQLRYTFGPGAMHQIFVGTSRSDIVQGVIAAEVGYKMAIVPDSYIAISVLPTIVEDDTWADPFVVNQEREETEQTGKAYRLQYNNIFNTGVSFDLAYYDREIEEELSGTTSYASYSDQLDREGNDVYGKLSGRLMLDRITFIQPSVKVNRFDAVGEAMSNNRYGAAVTIIRKAQPHSLALTGEYISTNFEQENPVFGKTQSDSELGFKLAYEYGDLLGIHTLGFNVLLAYTQLDSNIDFYDENNLFTGVGVSYKF